MSAPVTFEMSIDAQIGAFRQSVAESAPELLDLFEVYANEARFGRLLIQEDLADIPIDSKLIEIGGGMFLLGCLLQQTGYQVSILEPLGEGFTHFADLQKIILQHAQARNSAPEILDIPVEALSLKGIFTYAYSINVMEHVASVPEAIIRVVTALKAGGKYRFICPNYSFPYEPHFNMPTLFSKRLTEKYFKEKILGNKKLHDPLGTWTSLNWITVGEVMKISRRQSNFRVCFHTDLITRMFQRVATDASFAGRRSLWMRQLIRSITFLRLDTLLKYLPARCHPVMDCTLYKYGVNDSRD